MTGDPADRHQRSKIRAELAARYDALWDAAAPEVRAGRIAVDPRAADKASDERRGVNVIAHPAPAVADALAAFAAELGAVEPAQYYQPRGDLHMTVLSVFTGTPDYRPHLVHVDAYREAVAEAVAGVGPFAVDACGVTLTTGAVLVQGFPRDGTLERLRDRLRGALTARGFAGELDRRYRLVTAHSTLVRFTTPLRDPARFVDRLAAARAREFGTSTASSSCSTTGITPRSARRHWPRTRSGPGRQALSARSTRPALPRSRSGAGRRSACPRPRAAASRR